MGVPNFTGNPRRALRLNRPGSSAGRFTLKASTRPSELMLNEPILLRDAAAIADVRFTTLTILIMLLCPLRVRKAILELSDSHLRPDTSFATNTKEPLSRFSPRLISRTYRRYSLRFVVRLGAFTM